MAYNEGTKKESDIAKEQIKPIQENGTRKELYVKNGFIRHLVAILALSSILLANMNRQAFNQALVGMTRPTLIQSFPTNDTLDSQSSLLTESTTNAEFIITNPTIALNDSIIGEDTIEIDDRFDWTASQIATLQSAFSYGYTPFMILGGRLSEIYGAKWVIFASGFGSALCCLLSPLFADINFYLLVGTRVFMGLSQTGVSPALFALLVRWLPPEESNVYLPMLKVAVMVGFTMGALVSGFTTWRVTFYLLGIIGVIWSTMWMFLVSSDPSDSSYISKSELNYVQAEIRKVNKGRKQSVGASRKAAAPWFYIFTNPIVLAFTLTKFTVKLSTEAQTTQIPMYLKKVFDVSKELNGVLVATNFAIQSIFTGFVAWMAKEFVVQKFYGLNKTQVRRLFQGLSNFGMAGAYLLITFNFTFLEVVCAAIIILSVSAMFGAGGEALTPVDLSLEYSATIMAIANSAANFSGIILPNLVSLILDEHLVDSRKWNLVWMIVAGIIFAGGLTFTCIVTAELQEFKKPDKKGEEKINSLPLEVIDIPL